jgi:phosphoglycolate phosphatase-like HAD superfamily hydrolase
VRCVGFLSGGISRGELIDAGAAAIYDGPADLLGHFPGALLRPVS